MRRDYSRRMSAAHIELSLVGAVVFVDARELCKRQTDHIVSGSAVWPCVDTREELRGVMKELGFDPTAVWRKSSKRSRKWTPLSLVSGATKKRTANRRRLLQAKCPQEHGEARALTVEECSRVQVPDSSRGYDRREPLGARCAGRGDLAGRR